MGRRSKCPISSQRHPPDDVYQALRLSSHQAHQQTPAMNARQHDGYTSATEYSFSQDQTDAIVRVAAYHRRDFEPSMIWFPRRDHVGIIQSIATSFPRTSDTGLGPLDRFPLELVHEILLYLDMQSLFNLRQASLRSRQTVDSLHQYQRVVSHGLNVFCALLRTRLAIDFSLSNFYQAPCTKACDTCGGFGGFVSLLAWHRCCAACVRGALESQLQPLATGPEGIPLHRGRSRTIKNVQNSARHLHKGAVRRHIPRRGCLCLSGRSGCRIYAGGVRPGDNVGI